MYGNYVSRAIKSLEIPGYTVPDFGKKLMAETVANIISTKKRLDINDEHLSDPNRIGMIQYKSFTKELEESYGPYVGAEEMEELWYRMFDQIICDKAFSFLVDALRNDEFEIDFTQ